MRRQAVVISILILAAALRIYAISLYPLAGDEYGSLAEAKAVGLNWNSIIYSGFMNFWIRLGSSELWLRLPAAIFGVATIPVLFKIGEKLGGWRTGVVAALLAATSPFSIYHSQEVRFYSLFILAAAIFMLATISYLEKKPTARTRVAVLVTGALLLLSHFFGVLALYAQLVAMAFARKSRWSQRARALVLFALPMAACALLLTPWVRHALWRLYHIVGNAPSSIEPVTTPISILNLVKAAFAGFIFIFGYHVYPLRFLLVATGVALGTFLLLAGVKRLWNESPWKVLPFAYLFGLLVVYFVLDAVGGRVTAGVSPRHVAFVWPAFLVLTAIGITSFKRPVLYVLIAAALTVNAASIWSGWQKDWTYGITTDYRSAAEAASRWADKDTAIFHDGRSKDTINFYFAKSLPLINSWSYLQNPDLIKQLSQQRLIFVTDDWEPERRRGFDKLMGHLNETYSVVDGRVDYPLFEYALQRKANGDGPGFPVMLESGQVRQPLSIYGLEFQDLRLPVKIDFEKRPFTVLGAYSLPDREGNSTRDIPLAKPTEASRILVLSNVVADKQIGAVDEIADLEVITKKGQTFTYPIRLGSETALWDLGCSVPSTCTTVYRWHKRLAILGQSPYAGSLRDFQAGIHGTGLRLPQKETVTGLRIHYRAASGHFYLWGVSLSAD